MLSRYPALSFALFRRYWFASFASVGATQLITLGQGWLIFELTGSPLQLGWLGAAAAIPNIVMTLIGGVVADRFDKRLIMMWTSGLITVALALQAYLVFTDLVEVWHVLAIAATISLITGLDWPVRVAIYPQFVDRNAFLSAVALNAFIWQSTRMAMPAVGGLLLAIWNTWVLFALGAVGFAIMLWVMATLHVAPSEAGATSPMRQLVAGVRFIWHEQLFRWLIALTFVGMFFANAYVQIMPIFADLLEVGETGYGYLLSAGGVGAVGGTLLTGGMERNRHIGVVMLGAAAASIASLWTFAWAASNGIWFLALFTTFAAALCSSVFMIVSMTVMQLRVPDELRGRVMGIHTIGYSLIPLGGLFLGFLAERYDATTALLIGGSVYLAFLALLTVREPELRRLDGTRLHPDQPHAKGEAHG